MSELTDEELEEYIKDLDNLDITCEQKEEIVRTVYVMMEQFVDLAFGTDPVSLVLQERERDKTLAKKKTERDAEAAAMREAIKKHIAQRDANK